MYSQYLLISVYQIPSNAINYNLTYSTAPPWQKQTRNISLIAILLRNSASLWNYLNLNCTFLLFAVMIFLTKHRKFDVIHFPDVKLCHRFLLRPLWFSPHFPMIDKFGSTTWEQKLVSHSRGKMSTNRSAPRNERPTFYCGSKSRIVFRLGL